jgi:hypothetical protein
MADDDKLSRRDLADFLMKMFLENQAFARHHELARSTATAMFGGFATLLLGVSSFYWGQLNTAPVGAGWSCSGLVASC